MSTMILGAGAPENNVFCLIWEITLYQIWFIFWHNDKVKAFTKNVLNPRANTQHTFIGLKEGF